MRQFNNLSTWREETVVVKGKECFDLNFRDTTPNMFVIQNPNNAELFISISKIPTSKNYEFKVGKNCTDTLGRPTPTNRIYILNNADIDATIKVFSVMDTFDMNILKNFAVSLDSGEMQMDGVVKGFDSDVSLPAGNNFMGYVGLSDSERQSFADMITSLSNIKTDTNNMLAIKNNVVNTWDCVNKITNMLKGTFSPSSGEVDNVAEIIKKIIDFPTLSEYLYSKELAGSCDFAADIPDVETVGGYVSDTMENLTHLPTSSNINVYIGGGNNDLVGILLDSAGHEVKIYPRNHVVDGVTKYGIYVTYWTDRTIYLDKDEPIATLGEIVTAVNNTNVWGSIPTVKSFKLAMGFTRKQNGISSSYLENYYAKLDTDNFLGRFSATGLGDYDGTYEVSVINKTTHEYGGKTFYGVKFRFRNVSTTYSVDVDYFESGGSDINAIEYGCIYNLKDILSWTGKALYYAIKGNTSSISIGDSEFFNVFGAAIPVYSHKGILAQLLNKVKIPTIAGLYEINSPISFRNKKSTYTEPIKIADCIKFIENVGTVDLTVDVYYAWGNYCTFNIPAGGKIENVDMPIYNVTIKGIGGKCNVLGGLYG